MNVIDKVNFINSVADEELVICPNCGAKNKSDNRFCLSCGERLIAKAEKSDKNDSAEPQTTLEEMVNTVKEESAFKQANDMPFEKKEADSAPVKAEIQEAEPMAAFAKGLPDWNIEPPQVVVRRK